MSDSIYDYNGFMKARTTLSYPQKKDYTTIHVYGEGRVLFTGTPYEYEDEKEKYRGKVKDEVVDKQAYKEAQYAYNKERNTAEAEWERQIFKSVGAELGNPQHEGLWTRIWDDYHSCANDIPSKFEEYYDSIFN